MWKNSYTKFCLQLFLLACISPRIFGLQCHTCMFVEGVVEDLSCKDGPHLDTTKLTFRPCNNDGDALNGRELLTTPETKFRLGCLKTLIKMDGVNLLIRGCYGREVAVVVGSASGRNSRSTSQFNGNVCESPRPSFWTQLQDGPLKHAGKPLDITNAELQVCLCSDRDGCNGQMTRGLTLSLIVILAVIPLIVGD